MFVLVSLLKNLKHANIVTLHDIIHTGEVLTLVFEYVVSTFFITHVSSISCYHNFYLILPTFKAYGLFAFILFAEKASEFDMKLFT